MRCKNCGFDNEEGRYICENCGSPLYDEDNEINPENDNGDTKIIPNVSQLDEINQPTPQKGAPLNENDEDEDEEKKNKRNIIIIIVLAVILVAMIVGIVVSASVKNKKETTTLPSASVSQTTELSTTKHTTVKSTTTTEKETTTESTTEKTTEKETTTKAVKYNVYIDVDGNGSVSGDGSYEKGKKASLTATPDAGYKFDGWYDNKTGELVASCSKYTVNVNGDVSLTAKFSAAEVAQQ